MNRFGPNTGPQPDPSQYGPLPDIEDMLEQARPNYVPPSKPLHPGHVVREHYEEQLPNGGYNRRTVYGPPLPSGPQRYVSSQERTERLRPTQDAMADRGTLDRPNISLLSSIQKIDGKPVPTSLHQWPEQPWLAADYLADYFDTGIRNDPAAADLREWSQFAARGEAAKWEQLYPDRAREVRQSVRRIHNYLVKTMEIKAGTQLHREELMEEQSVSWVERMAKGTKEFLWDDFRDHPVMSVGLVVAGIAAYKMLKGTKVGKGVAIAGALTIGWHFLRDQFGIQPTELVADGVGMISKDAEAKVRKGLETLRRPFMGPEGEGSAIGYYLDELDISDPTEKYLLTAFLQANPKEFFQWYDSGSTKLPGAILGRFYEMDLPSHIKNQSDPELYRALRNVTEKYMGYMGQISGSSNPKGFLLNRYVTGSEFDEAYGFTEVQMLRYEIAHTTDIVRKNQLQTYLERLESSFGGVKTIVQSASDRITFLDILLAEESEETMRKVADYNGLGYDLAESKQQARELVQWADSTFNAAGNKVLDVLSKTLPSKSREVATYIGSKMDEYNVEKKDIAFWYKHEFLPRYEEAKRLGKKMSLEFLNETPVGRLVKASWNFTWEGAGSLLDTTAIGIDKLANQIAGVEVWTYEGNEKEDKAAEEDAADDDDETLTPSGGPAGSDDDPDTTPEDDDDETLTPSGGPAGSDDELETVPEDEDDDETLTPSGGPAGSDDDPEIVPEEQEEDPNDTSYPGGQSYPTGEVFPG